MRLSGVLTHASVPDILKRLAEIKLAPVVDLSDVERADSAAVALLLEIRRRVGEPLRLENAPLRLIQLIDALGIAPLLTGPPPPCPQDH